MLYSRSDVNINGNVHIIGSVIASSSTSTKGNITSEKNRTLLITPCVDFCIPLSVKLLKEPRFREKTDGYGSGEVSLSPPTPLPTIAPTDPPSTPTVDPNTMPTVPPTATAPPAPTATAPPAPTATSAPPEPTVEPEPTAPPTVAPTATPGGGGGGGGGCFLEHTMVKTVNGEIEIEKLKEGDYVLGFDGNNIIKSRVDQILIHENNTDNYYIVETEYSRVNVTGNHPFYTGNNIYRKIEDLNEGDYIYACVNDSVIRDRIISKKQVKVNHLITVYNMELEKDSPHNYFANGYLVHNNKAADPN
jgi:hypothetical protein